MWEMKAFKPNQSVLLGSNGLNFNGDVVGLLCARGGSYCLAEKTSKNFRGNGLREDLIEKWIMTEIFTVINDSRPRLRLAG